MAEINDLNVTDASNTARFPEGMAPSAVNDAARALEGILARWHKDTNASIAAGGTGDAITVTMNQTISAYYDGLVVAWEATAANTGAATLNADAVGGKALRKHFDVALAANDIKISQKCIAIFEVATDRFQLISPVGNAPLVDPLTTRGDLIVRGAAATTRLAIGAANRFLQSDGVDPAWGQVDLAASDVTGVLPSANMAAASDTAAGAIEIAVQSELEAATDNTRAVTPGRQHFHPGHPKAWLHYNQTGTPAITADYGVTSVADNATGDFTPTVDTAFSAATYGVTGCTNIDGAFEMWMQKKGAGTYTTTTIQMNIVRSDGVLSDVANNMMDWYGDL